MKREKHTSISA